MSIVADTQRSGSGMNREGYSQATERDFRIFKDQHGREYGADVEKSTNHPCGPISPRYRAPLYPPEHYMVIVDTIRSLLHIDYDRWIEDLERAHNEYMTEMFTAATDMYADKAADAVEKKPRALLMRVGPPPRALPPVVAMAAGNPWMLGFKDAVKPKIAELYFPEIKPIEFSQATEAGVVTRKYDDPFGEDAVQVEAIDYPHMFAPGRFYLSAQHQNQVDAGLATGFVGNTAKALQEIDRLSKLGGDPFAEE